MNKAESFMSQLIDGRLLETESRSPPGRASACHSRLALRSSWLSPDLARLQRDVTP